MNFIRSDSILPLTSSPVQPEPVERYQWVSFVASVIMHGLLLLALPWLLLRSALPPPPLEIEVQLESQPVAARVQHQYANAQKQSGGATRIVEARPLRIKRKETSRAPLKEIQAELHEVKKRKLTTAGHTIRLASSRMTAPKPSRQPGKEAKGAASATGQAASQGLALQGSAPASLPSRPAFAGRQPSIAQSIQPRGGENAIPGPAYLTGTTPAAQSLMPEYRQASRPAGAYASQGGALRSATGLDAYAREARTGGWQSAAGSDRAARSAPARPVQTSANTISSHPAGSGHGAPSENEMNRNRRTAGLALASAGIGTESHAPVSSSNGGGASARENGSGSAGKGVGLAAAPGEAAAGSLMGSSGTGPDEITAGPGTAKPGPDSGGGTARGQGISASEGNVSGLQLASAAGSSYRHAASGTKRAQADGGVLPMAASFETRENTKMTMQQVAPSNGSAHLLGDRYTASTVKIASPTHFCEIPLMLAGFNAKPIPKDLDSIMPSSSTLEGEYPPRHLPGNMMPTYPLAAISENLHGKVVLRAQILTSGAVGEVIVRESSGALILDSAAVQTVKRWRFQPALRNGHPVVAWMTVPIEYRNPQNPYGAKP